MAQTFTTIRCTTQWTPLRIEMNSHSGGICTVRCENFWFLSVESPEELLRFAKSLQAFAEDVLAEGPTPVRQFSWDSLQPQPPAVSEDEPTQRDLNPALNQQNPRCF
jgi:hypothetical protein